VAEFARVVIVKVDGLGAIGAPAVLLADAFEPRGDMLE